MGQQGFPKSTFLANILTAGSFETGAMRTPTKLQNPTNCG